MPQDVAPPDRHARLERGQSHDRRIDPQRSIGRLLLALVVFAGLLTALPAGPAEARSNAGRPTGEYTPKRVWQMHQNCIWAAGEMLLDKWTHGRLRVRQSVLRRASHDKKGGSSLYDLSRGIARVAGIHIPFSPGYGDTMAWWQLLDRLDHGGGAVLVGEYGDLPAHFSRWDRSFARRRSSSHAVYVQSYDRVRGRVWLMDPLADGSFPGEWIGVAALHRFATIKDGKVMAAATPARTEPHTAPLTDQAYRLGQPHMGGVPVAGSTVQVQIGLTITMDFPLPDPHRLIGHWVPIVPAGPPSQGAPTGVAGAAVAIGLPPDGLVPPTPIEVSTASAPEGAGAGGFSVGLPVPDVPGLYRLTLGLAHAGQRSAARTFAPLTVAVAAPFSGTVNVQKTEDLKAGRAFVLTLTVANIGTVDWRTPSLLADPQTPLAAALQVEPVTQTHVILTWRSASGIELPAAAVPAEIAPGHVVKLPVNLVAPPVGGAWTLVIDVNNQVFGTLSSTGRVLPTVAVRVAPRLHAGER